MEYRISALRNGRCHVAGNHAFLDGDPDELYEFDLFVWLIEGSRQPFLIEAGLADLDTMNTDAAHVLARPIVQQESEKVETQLRKHGYRPRDIAYIFITHLHLDHVDQLDMYPNARIVVSAKGLSAATAFDDWNESWAPRKTLKGLTDTWKDRVIAVDDQEVVPGIRVLWVGGHTPCSQAVCVDTSLGEVIFTGDTVFLLANIEKGKMIGIYTSAEECAAAMEMIAKRGSTVVPSHDPSIFERFPGGVIGK
jgi:glyoxylase-like metal-dependent hydrolase (beta-lactamase superfamily II)